jgi:holin-like protein
VLRGWSVLLLFQLAGEVIVRAAGLSFPGPVIGMALLLVAIELRGGAGEELETVSRGLLSHLSLLFVPAGVGVMLHVRRLAAEWPALLVSLAVSTVATIAVTGWIADRLSRGREEREEARP